MTSTRKVTQAKATTSIKMVNPGGITPGLTMKAD
jgi:hypothetical protein